MINAILNQYVAIIVLPIAFLCLILALWGYIKLKRSEVEINCNHKWILYRRCIWCDRKEREKIKDG